MVSSLRVSGKLPPAGQLLPWGHLLSFSDPLEPRKANPSPGWPHHSPQPRPRSGTAAIRPRPSSTRLVQLKAISPAEDGPESSCCFRGGVSDLFWRCAPDDPLVGWVGNPLLAPPILLCAASLFKLGQEKAPKGWEASKAMVVGGVLSHIGR